MKIYDVQKWDSDKTVWRSIILFSSKKKAHAYMQECGLSFQEDFYSSSFFGTEQDRRAYLLEKRAVI